MRVHWQGNLTLGEPPRVPSRLRAAESPGDGTVFAIPLSTGEYVLGVVIARYPRVIRAGLFPDPITELPVSVSVLSADLEIIVLVAASALDDGRWPVVGVVENFVTTDWPSPPMLPGEGTDGAQTPVDLERALVKVVERARRRRLGVARDRKLLPVQHDQGRRYAELVLGRGPLLARIVKEGLDLDAGSFSATLAFIEHDGEWQTGESNREGIVAHGGWVRADNYERALVPTLHRFLADPRHSVVFDYSWLELTRDASSWQRVETERFGPLDLITLQVFFRDEGSRREMYAGVGGGNIDEATTEEMLSTTFDPVIGIAFMLDVDIDKLPSHAETIDEKGLAELAGHVQGFALRYTSYDGYLVWRSR